MTQWLDIRRLVPGVSILVALAFVSLPVQAIDAPNRQQLLGFLRDGAFKRLEVRFKAYQSAYEAGRASDQLLFDAYHALGDTDPAVAARLNDWVGGDERSYAARMARGIYYAKLGWRARGARFIGKTAQIRLDHMRDYFDKAEIDLRDAARLEPNLTPAYAQLIKLAMASGEHGQTAFIMREGLARNPNSYLIRDAYLEALVPWWNGGKTQEAALAEVAAYIEEIRRDVPSNPHLKPLLAFDTVLAGRILQRDQKLDAAESYIDRAIKLSDDRTYFGNKAYVLYHKGQYLLALQYYDRAYARCPTCPHVLLMRGRIFNSMGNYVAAAEEWDKALAQDPYDSRLLELKAGALQRIGSYDEALAALDLALVHGRYDDRVRSRRGRVLLEGFDDPDGAIEDLEVAIKLLPTEPWHWYHLGAAFLRQNECRAAVAYATFLKLCEETNNCGNEWIMEARSAIDQIERGSCAK